MKNVMRSLPIKIICFILCTVCVISAVASVVGIAVMANTGFYTRSEQRIYTEISVSMLRNDTYNIMYYAFEDDIDGLGMEHYFADDVTNIRFRVLDSDNGLVCTNSQTDTQETDWQHKFYFRVIEIDGERHIQRIEKEEIENFESTQIFELDMYLEIGLPIEDDYALASTLLHIAYSLRYALFIIAGASVLIWIISFVILLCAAGRRSNSDEIHAGKLTKLPFDLVLGVLASLGIGSIYFIDAVCHTGDIEELILMGAFCLAAFFAFLWLCIDTSVRIKQKKLLENTVIWKTCNLTVKFLKWIYRSIKRLILGLPLVWKVAVLVLVNGAVDLLLLIIVIDFSGYAEGFVFTFWTLKSIIFSALLIYAAILMKKLEKGGQALASGDLGYRVDSKGMFGDFKRHADDLSSISEGMSAAVEQRLKSERTKAELITNVSHDIKTPLTSIINYASLISEESCENQKHKEYSAVLVKKSEHLKRLLEDIVEISKANTGNLDVSLSCCSAQVLLAQVAGEFEQRCKDAGLELVVKSPEENITIMADSRRIWRVFENLMNNACKYSLDGSRVYLSLEKVENKAVFVFKNTSRYALDISPDELVERFVRGDASRNTDGNGLGLSIASSLTRLQNGDMDITIDGDLFKVTVSFPTVSYT